jgi:1,2-dihydroxy-3-keto-5-methylthiopentene dioxygenase
MPELILADGTRIGSRERIQATLALLGVDLAHWPVPSSPDIATLLARRDLSDSEQQTVLASVDGQFNHLRREHGYVSRDLVVLNAGHPATEAALGRFARPHVHRDDEARYVLDGRGYFVFYDQAEEQLLLEVLAGDFLRVPAGAEHAFVLGDSPRLKAVRYFTDPAGWVPVYTDRDVPPHVADIGGTA